MPTTCRCVSWASPVVSAPMMTLPSPYPVADEIAVVAYIDAHGGVYDYMIVTQGPLDGSRPPAIGQHAADQQVPARDPVRPADSQQQGGPVPTRGERRVAPRRRDLAGHSGSGGQPLSRRDCEAAFWRGGNFADEPHRDKLNFLHPICNLLRRPCVQPTHMAGMTGFARRTAQSGDLPRRSAFRSLRAVRDRFRSRSRAPRQGW